MLALHSELLPGADSIFSGQPACSSKKASYNLGHLTNRLGINPIPELICAKRPAGMGADYEVPLMQEHYNCTDRCRLV